MTQQGKGGVRFSEPSGGTASAIATDTRLSRLEFENLEKDLETLELRVAGLEEKVKTLEIIVKDIRWGSTH